MVRGSKRHTLLGIVIGLFIGAIATSLVWATTGGSAEVRVAVRMVDDGRVEVAVQQRSTDERVQDSESAEQFWSERALPNSRFLAADAEPGRWYVSDGVTIATAEPTATDITEIGPFEIAGSPTGNRPFDDQTLFCVITHGVPSDFFWFQVYSALVDAQQWNDVSLRAEMYEVSSDQAAAISQCVEDGAAAIATTLADPDALKPALTAAGEAGVRLVTFNSGADNATDVGSAAHVSLDEVAVGRIAAEQFAERTEAGEILCIIHEPTNTGLEQRCDSLEDHYAGGTVSRVRLSATDADAVAAIREHLSDGVTGAIALNANTAYDMVTAISGDYPDVVLAAVSADFPLPFAMLHSERLSFLLWSHALEQGYLTTTALLYAHGSPFPPEIGLFGGATQIAIQPTVITSQAVINLFDADNPFAQTLPAWIDALQRAIDRENEETSGE